MPRGKTSVKGGLVALPGPGLEPALCVQVVAPGALRLPAEHPHRLGARDPGGVLAVHGAYRDLVAVVLAHGLHERAAAHVVGGGDIEDLVAGEAGLSAKDDSA